MGCSSTTVLQGHSFISTCYLSHVPSRRWEKHLSIFPKPIVLLKLLTFLEEIEAHKTIVLQLCLPNRWQLSHPLNPHVKKKFIWLHGTISLKKAKRLWLPIKCKTCHPIYLFTYILPHRSLWLPPEQDEIKKAGWEVVMEQLGNSGFGDCLDLFILNCGMLLLPISWRQLASKPIKENQTRQ